MTSPTPSVLRCLLLVGLDAQAGPAPGHTQAGVASYYHDRFHGRKTASGARYNKNDLSAAHKSLPLGSKVKVTDSRTGTDHARHQRRGRRSPPVGHGNRTASTPGDQDFLFARRVQNGCESLSGL